MKRKLIEYIDLLFAGSTDAEDMKQEILQNTLDRYDDLIAQGKSQESAYALAISGIGDIGALLNNTAPRQTGSEKAKPEEPVNHQEKAKHMPETSRRKMFRSLAVGLFILSPIPLFIFEDAVGLCLLLLMVAVGTVLMMQTGGGGQAELADENLTPQQRKLRKSIRSVISAASLILYLLVSFTTHAWHISWLVFPIAWAINGLVMACLDLKEAM